MILSTMTYEEMYRELVADHVNLRRWEKHQRRRIMDVARRCKSFPKHMFLKYTSPRRNDWLTSVTIVSRNPYSGSLFSECVLRHADDGWYAHQLIRNRYESIYQVVITPHFFKRYAERRGIDMKTEELMMEWMKNANDTYVDTDPRLSGKNSRDGEHDQWHLCTNEGIMMGDYIKGAKTFVAKTYITYDMTAGRQANVFGAKRGKLFKTDDLKKSIQEFYV